MTKIEGQERLLIPLYEMTDSDKEASVTACQHEPCYWVAVASKSDLSKQQWECMNNNGAIIHTVRKGTRSCLKSGWWGAGERKQIKSKHEIYTWEKRKEATRQEKNGRDQPPLATQTAWEEVATGLWKPPQHNLSNS